MEMKELKTKYDEILKKVYIERDGPFYMGDFPYSEKYPLYLKRSLLTNIMKCMSSSTKRAYREAKEITEENGIPPKFLSVGSSASFCFISLNIDEDSNPKEGADFFAEEGDTIKKVTFEKKLPILNDLNDISPHMDAYAKGDNREYFFECECNEMFDEHPIVLSKKYFATSMNLIVDFIPKKYLKEKEGNYEVSTLLFGLTNPVFDIKKFLIHLMEIRCNQKKPKSSLIYYYCFPSREAVDNEEIVNLCYRLLNETKTVFSSPIIKKYCDKTGIKLSLYLYKKGPSEYAASSSNTSKVI
jgi:hypothetical protein